MSFNFTKSLLIFISLVLLVNSSLIYENWPDSVFLEKFKKEIQEVQALKSAAKIDFGVSPYKNDTLQVNIMNVKQMFNYIEVNRLNFEYDGEGYILQGPKGVLSFKYTFDFNTSEGTNSTGSFSLNSDVFQISKTFKLLNNSSVLQPQAEVKNLTLLVDELQLDQELEENVQNTISFGLNDLMNKNKNNFIAAYNKDLSEFYSSFPTNKTSIKFNSKDPQLEFQLDLTYDRLPQRVNNKSVIFYKSGNINEHQNTHKEIKMEGEGFQILINKQVVSDFLTDLIKDKMLDFGLTQNNRPMNIPFNLNIESLGKILPEIYNVYSRNEEIKIYSVVSNVNMNNIDDGLSGQFTLQHNIYLKSDMTLIISFESSFSFALDFSLNTETMRFNFFLDNYSVDIANLKIINLGQFVNTTVYLNTFKRWTELALKNYLEQNIYYLLQTPFDLKAYFRSVSDAYVTKDGFVIVGSHVGFITENENEKVNVEDSNSEDNLKFLFK